MWGGLGSQAPTLWVFLNTPTEGGGGGGGGGASRLGGVCRKGNGMHSSSEKPWRGVQGRESGTSLLGEALEKPWRGRKRDAICVGEAVEGERTLRGNWWWVGWKGMQSASEKPEGTFMGGKGVGGGQRRCMRNHPLIGNCSVLLFSNVLASVGLFGPHLRDLYEGKGC